MTWAPTDVLRLIVAAVLWLAVVALGALFYSGITDFLTDLLRGLDRFPEWFVTALAAIAELMILALLGGGLLVALWRREWRYIFTLAVALVASAVVFLIAQAMDGLLFRGRVVAGGRRAESRD